MTLETLDELDNATSGTELLAELRHQLTRYVILPDPESVDAVVLWIAATHAQPAWEHATRLVVKSPLRRCGKTRLQEIIGETCHNPLMTNNISPAALVRSIDANDPPTIILDEADTVFATRRGERSESAEDLRGLLNSGHSRGWPYIRWDAAARAREECPTFAMALVGGIGDMPDTIEDRAVIIAMRRRAPGETVTSFRRKRSIPALRDLRERLADWIAGIVSPLADAEPAVPAEDRAADVWEPLVAVADAAGGDWPERARNACRTLTGGTIDPDDRDPSERLLADLKTVFGDASQLPTATLLEQLANLDEAPWSTWSRGERITPAALSKLLKPYGVRSKVIRVGAATPHGYIRADLSDPWNRYVREAGDPTQQPQQPQHHPHSPCSGHVAADVAGTHHTAATGHQGRPDGDSPPDVAPVAPVAANRPERAHDDPCCDGGSPVQLRCQLCPNSPTYWRNT